MTRILVPQLDANLLDVTVTAWRKHAGDAVDAGEIVAELTTDKATFELESPDSGILLEILAAEKSIVPAGYILALLGAPGEQDPGAADENAGRMEAYRRMAAADAGAPRSDATRAPRVRATPRARRLAREHALDLARIQREPGAGLVDEAVLAPYLPRPPA